LPSLAEILKARRRPKLPVSRRRSGPAGPGCGGDWT